MNTTTPTFALDDSVTITQATAIYNAVADDPIKKFSTRPDALRRTTQELDAMAADGIAAETILDTIRAATTTTTDDNTTTDYSTLVHVITPTPTTANRRGPNTPFSQAVIQLTGAANPARENTMRHQRFALMRSGMTVHEYYDACRAADIPCSKNNPLHAMNKGYITLTMPDGTILAADPAPATSDEQVAA